MFGLTEYIFVCDFGDRSSYDRERHRNKYNWKFSEYGDMPLKDALRLTTWQIQLAIL